MPQPDWLTHEQIDLVTEGLSAADILDAQGNGRTDAQVAGAAFDLAAARLKISNGTPATQHLRPSDLKYMAEKFGEVVNIDSPLSEGGSVSPESPSTGESVSAT
jgi:hypothetical protein